VFAVELDWLDSLAWLDCVDVLADDDVEADEDDAATAVLEISSSRSAADDLVAVVVDPDAVAAEPPGACAANHAPRPTNAAALTAPVMRRAGRAGCGFFVVMGGACARHRKTT